jgi:hypothetical protein
MDARRVDWRRHVWGSSLGGIATTPLGRMWIGEPSPPAEHCGRAFLRWAMPCQRAFRNERG